MSKKVRVGDVAADHMGFRYWPGYTGAFTRHQAEGAIPNGEIVMKQASESEDGNPNGTLGTVLGSIDAEKIDPALAKKYGSRFFYFIEWQPNPCVAVGVAGFKIARRQ